LFFGSQTLLVKLDTFSFSALPASVDALPRFRAEDGGVDPTWALPFIILPPLVEPTNHVAGKRLSPELFFGAGISSCLHPLAPSPQLISSYRSLGRTFLTSENRVME